jgi:hypothetical protein
MTVCCVCVAVAVLTQEAGAKELAQQRQQAFEERARHDRERVEAASTIASLRARVLELENLQEPTGRR